MNDINDLNNLSKQELLAYQNRINQLLSAHYIKDTQAIDSEDIATVKKTFNLDETHDLPKEIWTHFWQDKTHYMIDGSNIDFFLFLMDLDGFAHSEKNDNSLNRHYDALSFTQCLMFYNMIAESHFTIFEKLFNHPKTHQVLVDLIQKQEEEFFSKGPYHQKVINLLLENKLLSLQQDFSIFDDSEGAVDVGHYKGLFSLWQAVVCHHQLDWEEEKLKTFTQKNWSRMDIQTLETLSHEYFYNNPLSFDSLPDLMGPNKHHLEAIQAKQMKPAKLDVNGVVSGINMDTQIKNLEAFIEKRDYSNQEDKVISQYAYIFNRPEDYVSWLISLPHENWKCLDNFLPTFIKGMARAYNDFNLDDLAQTNRNVYHFLGSIKEDNPALYEEIKLSTPELMAQLMETNPSHASSYNLFLNEFGKITLALKLNTALIDDDNLEDDKPSFKV